MREAGDIYFVNSEADSICKAGICVDNKFVIQIIPEFKYHELQLNNPKQTVLVQRLKSLTEDQKEDIVDYALLSKTTLGLLFNKKFAPVNRLTSIYKEALNYKIPFKIRLRDLFNYLQNNKDWEGVNE